MANKKLEVKDLQISFKTDHGLVRAVRNISFDLYEGETLCIVGESGSGKSVTSKAIMGILANNAIIDNGSIMYNGENLLEVSEDEFYKIRGHKIGMIFQDPLSSLNPIVRIGKQITEATLINSNKLKLMYNDLISEDLIAYKNTLSKMNIKINAEKQKIVVFESECKKKIEDYEKQINSLKEKVDEKNYELKSNIAMLKADCKEKIRALDDDSKAEVAPSLLAKLDVEIANLNSSYSKEIAKLSKEVEAEVAKVTEELNAYKVKASEELKVLKAPLKETIKAIKEEALVKAKPLKDKLKVTQKEAREKVKAYKDSVTKEHKEKLNSLKAQLSSASTDDEKKAVKELIEKENLEFVNKLKITKAEAKRRALEIMKEVGIPQPEKRFKQYPFEFSGGMRQRIVIAIALTEAPEILICDEPTTALDVTIQAQILELINNIKKERNLSVIFITHNLGVVANMADRIAVMYAGKIVEKGMSEEIFYAPAHPYTWALLSSMPDLETKEKLESIPGTPPNMIYPPKGDAFAARNKYALEIDFELEPPLFEITPTHYAATWLLHPDAPKVELPKIIQERINRLGVKSE